MTGRRLIRNKFQAWGSRNAFPLCGWFWACGNRNVRDVERRITHPSRFATAEGAGIAWWRMLSNLHSIKIRVLALRNCNETLVLWRPTCSRLKAWIFSSCFLLYSNGFSILLGKHFLHFLIDSAGANCDVIPLGTAGSLQWVGLFESIYHSVFTLLSSHLFL